jgi:hypothetical protein
MIIIIILKSNPKIDSEQDLGHMLGVSTRVECNLFLNIKTILFWPKRFS